VNGANAFKSICLGRTFINCQPRWSFASRPSWLIPNNSHVLYFKTISRVVTASGRRPRMSVYHKFGVYQLKLPPTMKFGFPKILIRPTNFLWIWVSVNRIILIHRKEKLIFLFATRMRTSKSDTPFWQFYLHRCKVWSLCQIWTLAKFQLESVLYVNSVWIKHRTLQFKWV
jgi:hypothetical protein